MDINELQVRLLHAAKTKDQWKVVTSYPKKGEVCLEAITSTGATSFKIKIGDGTRPYCRNTGTPESPVWDFTSDQVLPYFGTTVVTDGTVSVVSIGTYTEGSSIKKKLVFYPLSLASSTVEGVTTLSPVLGTNPYLEIREGTGIEFTVDETGTPKLLNINISSSYLNDTITSAINALDTPSPLNLVEWDSSTNTLSLYSLSEINGIVSKSSTAIATIDLSGIAPVQDVQINSTSILSNGVADIAVDGTYDSSTNKIATESTVSSAVADLDVAGYGQATIDTTTSNQTTLTVKGIKEDDGKITADSTQDVNIVMDGTYNATYNKVATQTTVSNAIVALDGIPTIVDTTGSTDVITTISETNGVVSSTKKTLVEGNKIDISVPTTGTSTGDIIISHEDIDTTATDVASTITTDGSSTVAEKELDVITGLKVDAQGHIIHIDKDVSTNLVAADIKGSVSVTDDSAWIYRPTGGTISIGEDIAKVNGLEGNSCVWNQIFLSNNAYPSTSNNISFTKNDNGSYTIQGTATARAASSISINFPVHNNKIYIRYSENPINLRIEDLYNGKFSINKSSILDAPSSRWDLGFSVASGASVNYTVFVEVFNLTLLGIDNFTTVTQVEEWLAQHVGLKPYYAYNPGEILSAKTLGFNTYGQNLLNPTTKKARLVTYTDTTNSNKYTIKNIPDETTVTYTPYNTGTSVDVTSLIENDTFDITSYGDGILELSTVADDTYICIKRDGTKDNDIVPYEEYNYSFDVTKVYGRVNGAGEYVQCYPQGLRSVGSVHDILTANEAVVNIGSVNLGTLTWTFDNSNKILYKPNFNEAKSAGDAIPSNILTVKWQTIADRQALSRTGIYFGNSKQLGIHDTTYSTKSAFEEAVSNEILLYELATPITYTNLIYSEDGGQTGTPLKKVLLTMNVNDWGTEEQVLPDYVNDNPASVPANVVIEYKSNFKEAVLDTIDKVNGYKNPVRGANNTPQTTDKLAVYDSDSTVKSSEFEISNSTIDPEGTSNETTVPTINAVVDYVEDVIDTEVTVKDITTTDDDVSGNGGIRVTNSGTTYDVHHTNITQTDTTKQSTGEVIANVVTNVTVDSFGHVKGKEVISSDKLVAADIKAPVKQTDNSTWNYRITGGDISIGEDTAKIPVLKGNTLVWNQLVDSSATSITLVANNKYFTVISGTKSIQTGAGTDITVTGGTDMVTNLTNMFGSGNEPSTVEEFEKLFPNDYYPYNEGELISLFDASKTFNIWDEEWEVGSFDTDGTPVTANYAIRSKNLIKILSSTNYFVKSPYTTAIFEYDSGMNLLKRTGSVNGTVVTTQPTAKYIKFFSINGGNAYNHDICINISNPEYNELYLPYGESLPFGVKSIGFNQFDESTLISGKYRDTSNVETQFANRRCSDEYYRCLPNTQYYLKTNRTSGNFSIVVCWYDSNKQFISGDNGLNVVKTSPINAAYFRVSSAEVSSTICINISDPAKNGTYEPYKQDTLDLSWIKSIKDSNDNQLFPYGLLKAGSVYDEVTESKAIKRIGSVDLGTLNYQIDPVNRFVSTNIPVGIKIPAGNIIPNAICAKYRVITGGSSYSQEGTDLTISVNTGGSIMIRNAVYSDSTVFKTAMSGVIFYYELATPIEVDIIPTKNMSYLVDDLGTETQLPINSASTPITAPFVGTFEYKSNFKDTVIELIDKVNNAANPVKGINNTDQTVGKIAVYDSERTTHSSNYSASNATIVEGATGNDIILPAVETIVNYVNSKLSSALTYKGTVAQWSDLPTSGQNTGDMYIVSTTFTEQGVTYNAGDFFIWNGASWDIVSGTTSVDDKDISLTMNGNRVTVATVDGNDIHITPPNLNANSPSTSGTEVEFIDTVSQTNGLISATKRRVRNASTLQDGIVTLSSSIESISSEDSKVPTAYDTLTNLNNRDVDSGTITNDIATLSKRMLDEDSTSPTYESWINKTFYPETKYNAITDFSTAFGTNYPDLNTIESLGTTGFLKRTGNNTWELTDDTGKMKWLDETTNTYTYSAVSTNLEELGSYIHNYYGITAIEKAVLDNNNYGFRIDVPILSSNTATVGKVLKGTKDTGVDTLPIWDKLGIEELSELDNLGSGTGYLKRKAGATAGTYEWELSTPASTTVATTRNDGTETTSSSTAGPGIKVTTNGTTTYHRVPFSAISNDDSTGANAVTIILNGNFN